jgi:hypothetical protein
MLPGASSFTCLWGITPPPPALHAGHMRAAASEVIPKKFNALRHACCLACHAQAVIDDAAALALEALHPPVVAAMRAAGAEFDLGLASVRLALSDAPLHHAVCQECAAARAGPAGSWMAPHGGAAAACVVAHGLLYAHVQGAVTAHRPTNAACPALFPTRCPCSDFDQCAKLLRHAPHGCAGLGRALIAAAAMGHSDCVEVLLAAGADAAFQDNAPLLAAARADVSPQVSVVRKTMMGLNGVSPAA